MHIDMHDQQLNLMVVKGNTNVFWTVLKQKEIVQLMNLVAMSIVLKCKEKDKKRKT